MQQTHQPNTTNRPIVLRSPLLFRAFGALLLGAPLILILPALWEPRMRSAEVLIPGVILASIYVLVGLLFLGRHVTATTEGLSWRCFLRTHRVAWADVHDYYEIPNDSPEQSRSAPHARLLLGIATSAGMCRVSLPYPGDTQSFRERVQQCATAARTNGWFVHGIRPALDWPMSFHYRTPTNRFMDVVGCVSLLGVPGVWFTMIVPLLPHLKSDGEQLGWIWPVSTLLFYFLGPGAGTLLGALAALAMMRDRARRRGQEITVTDEGLQFTERGQRLLLRWHEIIRCTYCPMHVFASPPIYTVSTADTTIEFTRDLDRHATLCRIIEVYAVNAATPLWSPVASRTPARDNT